MEKEHNKKKKKLKWQVKLLLILMFIILYSFFLGTKGIFVKEYKIETQKISSDASGLKILHFSDLHYGSSVNMKMIKSLVNKINQTKPDIVIFTGDLIDERHKITNDEKDTITKELSKINSELGKYYVTGEEDFEDASSILNLAEFTNLEKNPQLIYTSNTNPILLIDKDSTKEYFETTQNIPEFKILALHNPDDINNFKKYNFDMAIAGHTHNGQINIFKIKELLIDSNYKKSFQTVGKTKLYITPGVGTSVINARMFNHPTIFLYRINKTSAN